MSKKDLHKTLNKGMSRRDFIKGAAAGAVGLAASGILNACSSSDETTQAKTSESLMTPSAAAETVPVTSEAVESTEVSSLDPAPVADISKEYECDLVVAGGGASGVCTAVRAAEKGLKVILLEKTAGIGGASNLSFAATAYGSRLMKEAGDETDLNEFISTWTADSHWRVDASVIRQLVTTSGEAMDWMSDHGWEFYLINAWHVLPEYTIRSGLWTDMVNASVIAGGGELLTGMTAKRLETDADGAVTAVLADDQDGVGVRVSAKAVVIATGGYAGDAQMVEDYFGFGGVLGGLPQNIGEGLKMSWAAGAKFPDNMGGQMLHQTLAKATAALVQDFDPFPAKYPMILTYLPMMLNVGATGERFRDEALTLTAVPAAYSSAAQGPFHYVVVSKQQIDTLIAEGLTGIGMTAKPGMPPEYAPEYELDSPWEDAYAVLDAMVEAGFGYKGDTIETLAENSGMDVDTFMETYDSYESFCSNGEDSQFNKAAQYLLSLGSEGPFYIVIAEINNLCSWGGLVTNRKYQVLNEDRKPIKGLYGVGNEAGSVLYNDTYVGDGIGMCNTITSGYLCGAYVSEFITAKS